MIFTMTTKSKLSKQGGRGLVGNFVSFLFIIISLHSHSFSLVWLETINMTCHGCIINGALNVPPALKALGQMLAEVTTKKKENKTTNSIFSEAEPQGQRNKNNPFFGTFVIFFPAYCGVGHLHLEAGRRLSKLLIGAHMTR